MTETKQETEPKPSTIFRKIVTGGSLMKRREFLKHVSVGGAALGATPLVYCEHDVMKNRAFSCFRPSISIGIQLHGKSCRALPLPAPVQKALKEIGIDYINFFFLLTKSEARVGPLHTDEELLDMTRKFVALCKPHNWRFTLSPTWRDLPAVVVEEAIDSGLCDGVLYDEWEHYCALNQRSPQFKWCLELPPIADVDGLSFPEARDAQVAGIRRVQQRYARLGAPRVIVSNVWPVMNHQAAQAGTVVCPKIMKELYSPVSLAIALGAALQYGPDLWANIDMSGRGMRGGGMPTDAGISSAIMPPHSPQEYRANLLFAYWMGVSRIYTEAADFVTISNSALMSTDSGGKCRLTPYGETLRDFCRDYVPKHTRPYTWRKVCPEVAIVRLDDTDHGQRFLDEWWQTKSNYYLMGASNLHPSPATSAWLSIWDVLTHGTTGCDGLTFFKKRLSGACDRNPGLHSFFVPLNGVVVYDDLVDIELLRPLKLIFLTGVHVSKKTLDAVRSCVASGATCVAYRPLVGNLNIALGNEGEVTEVPEGSGRWVITDDFGAPEVRRVVAPFLGPPDEIRYRFGETTLRIRRVGDDPNRIEITLTP